MTTIKCPRHACAFSDPDTKVVAEHIADVHKPKGFTAAAIEFSLRQSLARASKPVRRRREATR